MFTKKAIGTVTKWMTCLHEFGAVRGLMVLSQLYRKRDGAIRLPGYAAPIHLRTGSSDISDVSVFDKVFIQREYDLDIPGVEPQLIIDGGANIGCASVFFANRYPQARIIAVEPEPSNFKMLVQNTRAYPNVTPVHAALWTHRTGLTFTNTGYGKMAFQVQEVDEHELGAVQAVTIPDLLELAGKEQIDILKLDIECAEKELFESNCASWLDRVRAIVIELHDWIRPGNGSAFYRAVSRYDFYQIIKGENVLVKFSK